MSWLSSILGWLPFNGDKTKIGFWLGIYSLVTTYVSTTDLQSLYTMLTTSGTPKVAIVLFVVGLVHKILKAYYPDAVIPE